MDGCAEWRDEVGKLSFENVLFGAKDCVCRCPKLDVVGMESDCMPSRCGGSPMLSRGLTESAAVVKVVLSGST